MAVCSFAFSSSVLIAGIIVVNNKAQIIDNVKEQVIQGVSEVLPELINGAVGGAIPSVDVDPPVSDVEPPTIPTF